ncbi:MAG: methyltransferase domain-containing protein [Pseudanabaena sp.]|jgi:SAM-dependent methyltransferase|nr:methyltransferase domain-containing protein [Pseudanabaena sp. M051S1SP2A07QC]MCA6525111.1 methyltransferase domain-containing protein [Pseudanabaena sp. M179S2SP2A07QC]MCA6531441.1 methyltransferase domain-containing protein [Pseudanabaena sp. M125S2SP2A07QC]MCA6532967.1 methyltransferase domain-containing protein [Pseudanabaena sp. M176S2SP2A07QC]MCA6538458.1 methyltransferase domain-containing protein [Pseudanabaena sp. M037S2SP2A07QC]MCA6544550.1 methyltransferase domain-containing prot
MLPTTDPQYWEQRYQENTAKWDIGMAAPPFTSLLESSEAPIAGKTAVIGCGQGHDAILFAKHGFDTIGFDFAPSAITLGQKLSQTREISMQFLQRDIFELPQEFAASFDYAIEHTCFCAIRLEQRPDYVNMVRSILKPTGEFIALFWAHNRPDGPPFGVTLEEIKDLFSASFDTSNISQVNNSIASRNREEYLARFRVLR